jgi:thioredoxin reductase (NADPH)
MDRHTTVAVIGGGAAGLTAALFLSRASIATEVFDQDRSILKRAQLNNLPGSSGLEGRDLLAQLRGQLADKKVPIHSVKVDDIAPSSGGFVVHTADGSTITTTYVVLATGQGTVKLASLPLQFTDARQPFVKTNVVTDQWGQTTVPGVWAAGVVAGWPSQAAVCTGSGANVAIEIVSKITGEFWVDHDDSQHAAEAE